MYHPRLIFHQGTTSTSLAYKNYKIKILASILSWKIFYQKPFFSIRKENTLLNKSGHEKIIKKVQLRQTKNISVGL